VRELEVFSPEKGCLWEDLIVAFQCMRGASKKDGERLSLTPVVTGQGAMVLN